jgi:hypothetical protein
MALKPMKIKKILVAIVSAMYANFSSIVFL